MSIIGFHFTKLRAERTGPSGAKHTITNKTAVNELKEVPVGAQKGLCFSFSHEIQYEPNIGVVELHGELVLMVKEDVAKEALATFKKNKTFDAKLGEIVYNQILSRTVVEGIILSREIGLPPPVRLPRVAGPSETAQAEVKPAKSVPKKK